MFEEGSNNEMADPSSTYECIKKIHLTSNTTVNELRERESWVELSLGLEANFYMPSMIAYYW